MKNLIVINGEQNWQQYFPGLAVHQRRLQTSQWLFHDGHLWVFDSTGGQRVEGVLWRVGAIRPLPAHRTVLEMIRLAGVPCINPARVLLRGFDRLSMLNELREAGLPLIDFSVALGDRMLEQINPNLPSVIKIGNYHAGLGKARPLDAEQWADVRDLAFVSEEYVTVEPFVNYVRDIRCLAIGDQLWAMSRRGASWKANTRTESYDLIQLPALLGEYTRRAMAHLQADILGLDFLENAAGEFVLLESNDVPGLSGFPDATRQTLARLVQERLSSAEHESVQLNVDG